MREVAVIFGLFLFGSMFAQNPVEGNQQLFDALISEANILQQNEQYVITNAYQSKLSRTTHVYFSEELKGLEVLGTESSIHVDQSRNVFSTFANFIPKNTKLSIPNSRPSFSASEALSAALTNLGYPSKGTFGRREGHDNAPSYFFLNNMEYSFRDIKTQLKYLRLKSDEIVLVWTFLLQDTTTDDAWTVLVNAQTGATVEVLSWEQSCKLSEGMPAFVGPLLQEETIYSETKNSTLQNCTNCYEVFPFPYESPYMGGREIVQNPAHPIASPAGWHGYAETGSELTITSGNNTWAFDANDNYGFQPDGGEDYDFTGYDWDSNYSNANQYESAAITNAFYWVNKVHDVLYQYGFDEVSGNFQVDNFDIGGVAEDPIITKIQTSASTCNASFGVGPDGTRTVLTANVCNTKDAAYDSTVLIHEFGHGIYGRMTGGPASTYCLYNDERTTEGIADWYAIMLTARAEDSEDLERHIARYFFNRGIFGNGIRSYPYSTDMTVNPLTYDDIKFASIPHGVGEVWATMLWEVTWALINEHGFNDDVSAVTGDYNKDAGNIMALALVTEALKIQPCTPGFVTAREAILFADFTIYEGQNRCLLLTAFAKRGLGHGASQGSPESILDGTESYELQLEYAGFGNSFEYCFEDTVYHQLGGGIPRGGFYEGPGVTDNGDGLTFTLDILEAGQGIHEITYSVDDSDCIVASSASTTVTIVEETEPPGIICINDFTININTPENITFELNDFTSAVSILKNCDDDPIVTQHPEAGTLLGLGQHQIEMSVTDQFGNVGECNFLLTIKEHFVTVDDSNAFVMYPIPAKDVTTLSNPNLTYIKEVLIFDVSGKLARIIQINDKVPELNIDLQALSAGMYFASIVTNQHRIIRRFVKW